MKALIQDGKIIQLSEEEFEVHPSYTWVDNVPENVRTGWNYDGTNFSDPDTRTNEQKFTDALNYLRKFRDNLLAQSDWTQFQDSPITGSALTDWQTYRQGLRDVTTQSDPYNIVWPTKPS